MCPLGLSPEQMKKIEDTLVRLAQEVPGFDYDMSWDRVEQIEDVAEQDGDEPTCWRCHRTEDEHDDADYGEDGCCIRGPKEEAV